jgi:hypothetical protein
MWVYIFLLLFGVEERNGKRRYRLLFGLLLWRCRCHLPVLMVQPLISGRVGSFFVLFVFPFGCWTPSMCFCQLPWVSQEMQWFPPPPTYPLFCRRRFFFIVSFAFRPHDSRVSPSRTFCLFLLFVRAQGYVRSHYVMFILVATRLFTIFVYCCYFVSGHVCVHVCLSRREGGVFDRHAALQGQAGDSVKCRVAHTFFFFHSRTHSHTYIYT